MTKEESDAFAGQMLSYVEQCIPSGLSDEERDNMVKSLLAMYSDPEAMMEYANDPVFKDEFWNDISYQTENVTGAFKNGAIDMGVFIDTPMRELTKLNDEVLRAAAGSNSQIRLKDKEYYVFEGRRRYLWLATRGMPMVKDAPGIEVVQTYNMITLDQIVGLAMKALL